MSFELERNEKGVIFWKVRCINRTTREMFDRELYFDPPNGTPQDEIDEVRRAVDAKSKMRIVTYRQLFREVSEEEQDALLQADCGFNFISVDGYFEDELAAPLDEVDLISIMSGNAEPVILGNVQSIFRLGHSNLKTGESLSAGDSHTVFHFVQLVGIIQQGRWWQGGVSYSSGDGVTVPDLDSTVCALAIIRQFFLKRDQSFQRATEAYLRVVDDQRKAVWVDHERKQFDASLFRIPFGPSTTEDDPLKQLTCIEIIDLFVYGTGLFHRESDKKLEDEMMNLRSNASRELLLFKFHTACHEVLRSPRRIAAILHWEFAHWIASGSCPPPNRIIVENLFKNSEALRGWSGQE